METIKMSTRGQIVIPQRIRELLDAQEGTLFAVIDSNDSIILKKMATPSREELLKELKKIAVEGKKRAEAKGMTEKDIPALIERARKKE